MKDFREAAEKYEENLIRNGFNQFEQGLMLHGYKEGYSEAKKEVREFYADVRRFMMLRFMAGKEPFAEYVEVKERITKSLASFTEQEQKSLPFGE